MPRILALVILSLAFLAACTSPAPEVATFTLSLVVIGDGEGVVVSDPPGIDSERGSFTFQFRSGESVSLMATVPNEEHEFLGWHGACTGAGNCNLAMSSNRAVVAQFSAPVPEGTPPQEEEPEPEPEEPGNEEPDPEEPGEGDTGPAPHGRWIVGTDLYLHVFDEYRDYIADTKPGRLFVDYGAETWSFYNNHGVVCTQGITSGWDLVTEFENDIRVSGTSGSSPTDLIGATWEYAEGDYIYQLSAQMRPYANEPIPTEIGSMTDCLPPPPPPIADFGVGWGFDADETWHCFHRVDNSARDATGLELRYYPGNASISLVINRTWTSGDPPVFQPELGEHDHVVVHRGLSYSPMMFPVAAGWVETNDTRPNYEWVELHNQSSLVDYMLRNPKKWVFHFISFSDPASYRFGEVQVERRVLAALADGFGRYCLKS